MERIEPFLLAIPYYETHTSFSSISSSVLSFLLSIHKRGCLVEWKKGRRDSHFHMLSRLLSSFSTLSRPVRAVIERAKGGESPNKTFPEDIARRRVRRT